MSLRDELGAVLELAQQNLPEDVVNSMRRALQGLVDSGLAERALGVGAGAPRFSLVSASGMQVALEELLADGPVVVTFYRGRWCPYCNLALRALQEIPDAIVARGARLVAISPQVPDESLTMAEKEQLSFLVLSDIGCDVAKQFGIAFDLPDDLGTHYDKLGLDLATYNGGYSRTLPVPATYVIDRGGIIRWSFVDPDYSRRAEPDDILNALNSLC